MKDPIRPVKLKHKNLDSHDQDSFIVKNDSLTIRLQQAYIEDCFEIGLNPLRGFETNCEIAVVVSAFEMDGTKDFDFGTQGINQGRLVFYSGDVEPGQHLNFNNMPVYGPQTYNGGPIGLDIFIVEVDSGGEQMKALLGALASAGSVAYPPASPVLKVLDTIGGKLLSSRQDDIEFRYSLVLDPNSKQPLAYAKLETGNYAFIRKEKRKEPLDWGNLRYDENTGRIFVEDQSGKHEPFDDETYLTFQINKNLSSVKIDLSQNTFGDFRDALEAEDKEQALKVDEVGVALVGVARQRFQIRNFDGLRESLADIKAAQSSSSAVEKRDGRGAIKDILSEVRASLNSDGELVDEPSLSLEQIDYLLKALRGLASNASADTLALFDRTKVTGKFLTSDDKAILDLILPEGP